MKLLSADLSPYAARVRLAIYAGDLPVEIAPSGMWSPAGGKDPAYLAINPLGKVPCLVLDDGASLPESEVIVEYLADQFPEARLRPDGARMVAQARLLARIVDLYVAGPATALYMQIDPATRDAEAVRAILGRVNDGMASLEHFFGVGAYAAGDRLSTADCVLAPYLFFYAETFARALGGASLIDAHPKVAAYWMRIQADPHVAKVLAEMRAGIAASRLAPMLA